MIIGNVGVVTEGTTILIIAQVSSGFKKLYMLTFSKYKYFHVKIASLAVVKSCVTIGHFCEWQIFHLMHLPWVSSQS